ncbi:MAG: hypothetical protein ABI837_14515 [Acidobacteriota bacterium]
MIDFMPRGFFVGKRICLLDDTVYRGRELIKVADHMVNDLGVNRADISTATVAVHSRAAVDERHQYIAKYSDAEYIEWKEELARIVQRTLRPTDRDHPLYYYVLNGVSLARLLAILRRAGPFYSVGSDASGATIRFSVPLPRLADDERLRIPGLSLQSIPKIRLYCRPKGSQIDVTCVPMMFGRVSLDEFLRDGSEKLCSALRLDEGFFQRVWESDAPDRGRMLFFFATRGLAALALRLFLEEDVVPCLPAGAVTSVRPEARDRHVRYEFPAEYVEFHENVFQMLRGAVSARSAESPALNRQVALFDDTSNKDLCDTDPEALAPRLLAHLADQCEPAEWNGSTWEPRTDEGVDIEYRDLIPAVGDGMALSRILDELLDSGLLRARDSRIEAEQPTYARTYRCGGEYKAVEVARIRDSFECGDSDDYRVFGEEERLALWGSNVS